VLRKKGRGSSDAGLLKYERDERLDSVTAERFDLILATQLHVKASKSTEDTGDTVRTYRYLEAVILNSIPTKRITMIQGPPALCLLLKSPTS
jgi:hypothetical protein